eukprot:4696440-Amphidinium_carterae.1
MLSLVPHPALISKELATSVAATAGTANCCSVMGGGTLTAYMCRTAQVQNHILSSLEIVLRGQKEYHTS